MIGFLQFHWIAEQKNSFALASILWLHDIELTFSMFFKKEAMIHWKNEGFREEIVILNDIKNTLGKYLCIVLRAFASLFLRVSVVI